MKISLIAAMARNGVIGLDNKLPWRLPADLAWFKKNTQGKPLLMGRKTWESLPFRPLPGRKHFVLTRSPDYQACKPNGELVAEVSVVNSLDAAIAQAENYCQTNGELDELMIIGGATIYKATLNKETQPWCERMYLTIIDDDFQGDASFPEYDNKVWTLSYTQACLADENNPHDYDFMIMDKDVL